MKVFLSAVTAQFKSCRDALASDLRSIGCEVVVQEDLQQHPRTLLEKLQRDVDRCDRVIAIVGDAFGIAPDESVLPAGTARRSYTQWEYHFALGQRLDLPARGVAPDEIRKDIFLYFASEAYLSQHPVEQSADDAALQRDFVALIHRSNEDLICVIRK